MMGATGLSSRSRSVRRIAAGLAVLAGLPVAGAMASRPALADIAPAMRISWVQPVALTEESSTPPGVPLRALVDLSDQSMQVYLGDRLVETFKVSTGRMGYGTPAGAYQAQWLAAKWRSKKYHNAPMPWSVFFHGGYAIHGTTDIRHLGMPASQGWVGINPEIGGIFFSVVLVVGLYNS
jgi:lipoprotein-anchoring transpeptidase ErfK/SrfK